MRRTLALAAVITVSCVLGLDLDVPALHDPAQAERALASMSAMLTGLGHPDLGPAALQRVLVLGVQTVAVAVLGTSLGAVAGLGLAILGASAAASHRPSRARRVGGEVLRLGLDGLRALPDFAWALALLLVLGPGPITGALAIALSVTGILGRAFGQLLASVPRRSVRAIEALGGSPLAAVVYGRLPRIAPAAWSYGLARLECSIRNASVIGIVGGGGLGAELFEELGYGRMDRMATLLLGLVLLTVAADAGSATLRRRVSSVGAAGRRRALRVAVGVTLAAAAALLPAAVDLCDALGRLDPRVATRTVIRLLQPDLSVDTLQEALRGAGPPLALAWVSTAAATTAALALLPWTSTIVRRRGVGPAARPSPLRAGWAWTLRGAAVIARGVPEVAWLLLFAAALGMGALPALVALSLHATGVLVRLFTEAVDDRFAAAPRVGLGAGAGVGWLAYVALPRLRGHLVTHGALQAESNVRAAYTLGILGAGGIGEAFQGALAFWQLERASTLALVMVALFVGLDRLGRRLGRG